MRKVINIILAASLLTLASCGNNGGNKTSETEDGAKADSLATKTETVEMNQNDTIPEEPVFDMVTSLGTIRIKLYSDTPKHRDNFVKLANSGFYNGLLFHRVIKDFMIQGGDPLTKDANNVAKYGTGGPGYQIEAEILPNHHHKKGALAAARKGDIANPMKESSGSQFYIVQSEEGCRHLDGEYTIFGETLQGFEVIDKIANLRTDARGLPEAPVRIVSLKLVPNAE